MSCNCNKDEEFDAGTVSIIGIVLGIINFFFFEWLLGGLTDTQAFWLSIFVVFVETPIVGIAIKLIAYSFSKRK
jgi:uncharacterized membrane protein YccC